MQPRYSPRHQIVHWLTALCVVAIIAIAWVMTNAKEGASSTDRLFDWHGSLGIVVLLLTCYRIFLRFIDRPPPAPASLALWERALSGVTHVLFYAILLWMPVTGYLAVAAGGYPLKLFNLVAIAPLIAKSDKLNELMNLLHFVYGQWVVYTLIILHVLGVVFNLVRTRTGILGRMLPPHATEPTP